MGLCYFVNGIANNSVIPIAHKIATVYDLSSTYVNAPITASFLVYSFSNFPANFIIDTMGLRKSFIIGTSLYTVGIFLFTLINKGYFFVLIGAILVALGQPFIVNCPAKVATFWFLSKNVNVYLKTRELLLPRSWLVQILLVLEQVLCYQRFLLMNKVLEIVHKIKYSICMLLTFWSLRLSLL